MYNITNIPNNSTSSLVNPSVATSGKLPGETDIWIGWDIALFHILFFGSKYGNSILGRLNRPVCLGIITYSQRNDPVISSLKESLFISLTGGNTSKDFGNINSGKLNKDRFPVPTISITNVTASFVLTFLISTDDFTV